MTLICISGPRGSGKSLLASFLEHEHGFERFSLADELKREVMRDWGLQPRQLWGADKEVPTGYRRRQGQPLTARDIMIRHGEYRRCIDELYWCKRFDPSVAEKIVCDDLRFKNELDFFKQYGAKFVRIERKPELNIFKGALDDLSETELNEHAHWDFHLSAEENLNADNLKAFARVIADSLS